MSAGRLSSFPYRGGKYRPAPSIVKLLPSHRIYVEVFGGAANVLLAKPPSQIEVYNDENTELVNLFEVIRNHPFLFLERCQFLPYSRFHYQTWKNQLNNGFQDDELDKVEAAVRTYYCIVSGFIGDPTKGWAFQRNGRDGGPNRWTSVWDKVTLLSQRFKRVAIDCLDFRTCIKNWDTEQTCFFLDPPYLGTISHGFYGNDFTFKDHMELGELLRHARGKWLLTIDDTDPIRDLYKGFEIRKFSTKLQSQKIDAGQKRVALQQLLVANYPLTSC